MSRLDVLKNMLNRDPGDYFIRYAIALEYIGMNDNDKAKEELSGLLSANPDYLATYYQYGKLLEESGEIDQAEIIYKKGIELADVQNDLHTKSELQEALDNL
jgi:tetratricopeptide (TPR) repeat protein